MKKNQISTISTMKTLAWVLPMPLWPAIKLGSQPLRQILTLSNQSEGDIRITGLGFEHSDDPRVGLVGGTCHIGLNLAPQEACTLEIQVNPTALGRGKQTINIEHSGNFSPLWAEIEFSVVTDADARTRKTSYLSDDTPTMDRQRRHMEQDGHRRFARVNAREHPEQTTSQQQAGHEGGMQNNILQNPWLDSQRFDGVDPNLNPEPPLNTEARREFDNEKREQEMEKQLRLNNVPRVSPAPKPQGF
ncbi:MAG: hypothetical protein NXI01_03300 [Gammaproteobacteria bacterium]|nr:hypothetical protein [Gammaproteobacteria bacterium]